MPNFTIIKVDCISDETFGMGGKQFLEKG